MAMESFTSEMEVSTEDFTSEIEPSKDDLRPEMEVSMEDFTPEMEVSTEDFTPEMEVSNRVKEDATLDSTWVIDPAIWAMETSALLMDPANWVIVLSIPEVVLSTSDLTKYSVTGSWYFLDTNVNVFQR